MRQQRRILDKLGRYMARVEKINGRTYVYDKLNRRVGWVAPNGTFDTFGRLISRSREVGILVERVKER